MSVEFAVKLTDQVTAPTRAMAGGLAQAAKNANLLEKQMAALQNAATKAAATGNVAGFQKAATQYSSLHTELTRLRGEFPSLTAAQHEASGASKMLSAGVESLGTALTEMLNPATLAAAALGAIVAVSAAVGAALYEGAKMALEASEAFEKLSATMNALTGGNGKATIATLDELTAKLGMTRAQLAPLAEQLLAMGVPVAQLKTQLTALATVQAVGINGGTEAYLGLLKKLEGQTKVSGKSLVNLYKTGVSVAEIAKKLGLSVKELQAKLKAGTLDAEKFKTALAQAIQAKGAEALAAQARSLSAQWAQLQENIRKLFEDVNVKPFLDALKSLLSVFDQNTASGKALHAAVKGLFDGLFAAASKVLPYIKIAFLALVVGALKFYIALKPAIAQWKAFLGTSGNGEKLKQLIVSMAESFAVWGPIINRAAIALLQLFKIGVALHSAFGTGGKGVGQALVMGIIDGMTGGLGSVIAAGLKLGLAAVAGAKEGAGAHSPSVKTAAIGQFMGAGLAGGMRAANDNVSKAGEKMGSVAVGATAKGASGGAPGGGGSNTFNIEVHIGGGGKPEETKAAVLDGLADAFEKLGITRATVNAA